MPCPLPSADIAERGGLYIIESWLSEVAYGPRIAVWSVRLHRQAVDSRDARLQGLEPEAEAVCQVSVCELCPSSFGLQQPAARVIPRAINEQRKLTTTLLSAAATLQQGLAQTTAKSPSQPTKMLLLSRCVVAQVSIFSYL